MKECVHCGQKIITKSRDSATYMHLSGYAHCNQALARTCHQRPCTHDRATPFLPVTIVEED